MISSPQRHTTTRQGRLSPLLRTLAACFLLLAVPTSIHAQQGQDPSTLNGGSALAMAGENCVAIAVDKRYGSGPQMVTVSPLRVLLPHSRLAVALTGLGGDCQSVAEALTTRVSSGMGRGSGFGFGHAGGSGRHLISPRAMGMLTSHLLYGRRNAPYYVEPIVAGLERIVVDEDDEVLVGDVEEEAERRAGETSRDLRRKRRRIIYRPYLCAQDLIGARSHSDSFVCTGVASKSLYGTAEALWRPGLQPEELARVCGRAFLSALERDCLSGYGAVVYLITGGGDAGARGDGGIIVYDLACRND